MTTTLQAQTAPDYRYSINDLVRALILGWFDFQRAPVFGIVFSLIYVLGGLALLVLGAGTFVWTLALALGFPIIAPFAATGLYEVSRRIEAHKQLDWAEIIGVVWAERGKQIPWMGVVLMLIFLFWSFFAHMSFALFLGSMTLTNISTSYDMFLTGSGLAMVGFQVVVGALTALVTFALAWQSFPALLDQDIDFVTAMIRSVRAFSANLAVALIWAAVIACALFVAMLPLFLGLLVVMPVLGHATWHLYRLPLQDKEHVSTATP